MNNDKATHYLIARQKSSDWFMFLKIILEDMTPILGEPQMAEFMFTCGTRAGTKELALPLCTSLAEFEEHGNKHWLEMGWGVAEITDRGDRLEIKHTCVPTDMREQPAFSNFMQGVYQEWFRAAGAGDELRIRQVPSREQDTFIYHLVG